MTREDKLRRERKWPTSLTDEAKTQRKRRSGQQNSKDVTLTQTRQRNSDGHQADGGEQKGWNDEMNVCLLFFFSFVLLERGVGRTC